VQKEFNPENVARETAALLEPARRDEVKRGLARVRAALGEPGAARRAAEWVLRTAEGQ
jgi:lipid A disaccharide synthetase